MSFMNFKTKSIVLFGGFLAFLGVTLYPVIIHPKIHPEVYST